MAPDAPHIMPVGAKNGKSLRCSWRPFSEEVGRQGNVGGHRGDFSSLMFHEGPSIHQPDSWEGEGCTSLSLPQTQPLNAADGNQLGSPWPEITAASWRREAEGVGVGGQRGGGKADSSPSSEATRCHPHHPALRTPASVHPGGVFLALFWSGRNRPNAQGRAGEREDPPCCLLASVPWPGPCLVASCAEMDGTSLLTWLWRLNGRAGHLARSAVYITPPQMLCGETEA